MKTMRSPRTCSARRARHGVTLIELATAITVTSLLLSLVTMVVVRIADLEARSRRHLQWMMTHSLLADQLREDAQAATGLTITNGAAGISIQQSLGIKTEYTSVEGTLQRVKTRDALIVSREQYRIPRRAVASWSRFTVGRISFLRLEIDDENDHPLLTIVAQIGRHRSPPDATGARLNDSNPEPAN